jgi:hypothetical protein
LIFLSEYKPRTYIWGYGFTVMAIAREFPERYGWWINELQSLGLDIKKTNEFNDLKEIRSLTKIIKLGLYLDYKSESRQ